MADLHILRTVERWKQIARDSIDEIGSWRDAPNERQFRYQGWLSDQELWRFDADTTAIVAYVAQRWPKLDPAPIESVYSAISSWTRNRDAQDLQRSPFYSGILKRDAACDHRREERP